MGDRCPVSILKILVAVGITVTSLGLIFFVSEAVSSISDSFALQIVVSGVVILFMSIAAIKIFRGLEYG